MPRKPKSKPTVSDVAALGGRARANSLSPEKRTEIARTAAGRRWTAAGKPLSLPALQAMLESDLRVQILIPLFRAMGYLDVVDYHGGELEQGKDIVMWRRADFGRTNCAVVAKAKRINGQASGKGSAGEVAAQIRQCFGRPFHDGATPEEQDIHECIVVCPHEIKTGARQAIASGLDEQMRRHVKYLHGQGLWEEVRRHFGPRAALTQLTEIGQVLESASPNYRVVAKTRGAQIEVELEPKHPDALKQEPLVIKGTFVFPNDDSGQVAMAEFQRYLEIGTPVKVDAKYVSELHLPDLLQQVMGTDIKEIALTSVPSTRTIRLTIEVSNQRGDRVVVSDLDFRCLQAGSKEATLTANRIPYRIELVLRPQEHRFSVSVKFRYQGVNVAEASEAAQFQRILAGGCTLTLRESSTRLIILNEGVAAGTIARFDDELAELLSDLVVIQDATKTPIAVPSGELTRETLVDVRGIAKGLREGVVPIRLSDLSVTMKRRGVEEVVNAQSGASFRIALVRDEAFRFGDTEIQLGPVARVILNGAVTDAERERLRSELVDEHRSECEVRVECAQAEAKALYLRRLPAEELDRFSAMFPILKGE